MPIPVNPTGVAFLDGLLWGYKWDTPALTYSAPTTPNDYFYGPGIHQFEAMNPTQLGLMEKAIRNFDDVSGLTLTFTNVLGAGNIRLAEATALNYYTADPFDPRWKPPGGAPGQFPGTAEANVPDPEHFPDYTWGDVWFNHEFYNAPPVGSYFFAGGFLHEIGHAVGLKHGHGVENSHGATFNKLPVEFDSQEFTIMTYTGFVGGQFALKEADMPSTLMMLDILALQHLYGADYGTRAGNTTYQWSPTTGEAFFNGVGQGTTFNAKILMTVWDGGGIDTYNFSNFKSNAIIDLAPGGWSTPNQSQRADLDGTAAVHLARGSIANALLFNGNTASLIENAVGGSGNDTILGNSAANQLRGSGGADKLTGFGGKDSYYGGSGKDQFNFVSLSDSSKIAVRQDIVNDFAHGDKLVLKGIDANTKKPGNQAFTFHNNFTKHAGEVQWDKVGAKTLKVSVDVNGDGRSDMGFIVKGVADLTKVDFIL
ncbi:MAG: M10 family metallopeptidase [Hyphomicrobium sp.]